MSSEKIFVQHRTIRFGECDPAGGVYYPVFFNWFHELMEAWFENGLSTSYAKVIQEIGFPAKSCEAEFFRPIAMGDQITLSLNLEKLRQKGFCFQVKIYDGTLDPEELQTGSPRQYKAKGKVVCVGIGVKKGDFQFRPMPIPHELYKKMVPFVSTDSESIERQ